MIRMIPHRVEWAADFETIRRDLAETLGPLALRIDHIGSTSVPGLASKNVIDVQVTVGELSDAVRQGLRSGGYRLVAPVSRDLLVGMPTDSPELEKMLAKEPEGARRANVHVRVAGRLNQEYPLLFRDYLRADDRVRAAYEQIKHRLADLYPEDVDGYLSIKDPVMDIIYQGARSWAVTVGWTVERGVS